MTERIVDSTSMAEAKRTAEYIAHRNMLIGYALQNKLAVLCIKDNVQTEHANNKNIGELCKLLKEFTEEVVQVELPSCIANYKPVVRKPKAKPNRAKARQKDINEVKKSLFK